MIFYFSITGNSRYVAEYLGEKLDDKVEDFRPYIELGKQITAFSAKPMVFVMPVHAWSIPDVVYYYMLGNKYVGRDSVYFVMTCAHDIGNAKEQMESFCMWKMKKLKGVISIKMPNSYIPFASIPDEEKIEKILSEARKTIDKYVDYIIKEKAIPTKHIGVLDIVKSSFLNRMFYERVVKSDLFYATDQCISCGKCESQCIKENIALVDGKPHWRQNCIHCMQCIHQCPVHAIEYGDKTIGKKRYMCKEYKRKTPFTHPVKNDIF